MEVLPALPFRTSKEHRYIRKRMDVGNAYEEDYLDLRNLNRDKNKIMHIDEIQINVIPRTAHATAVEAHLAKESLSAITRDERVIAHHEMYGVASGTGGVQYQGSPVIRLDFRYMNGLRYPYDKLYFAGRTNAASSAAYIIFHLMLHFEKRSSFERARDNIDSRGIRN